MSGGNGVDAAGGNGDGRPANPHRGEVEIELMTAGGRQKFVMRPTFQCLVGIEARTGQGMVKILEKWREGNRDIGITDCTHIVIEGLIAAGVHPSQATFNKVGEMIFGVGLANVIAPVGTFLGALAGSDEERERAGERAAAAEQEGRTAAATESATTTSLTGSS